MGGQISRPARIVTVCVRGRPVKRVKDNAERIAWLEKVIAEIMARADWRPIDTVLLPAGYFWLDEPLITRSERSQEQRLNSAPFAEACRKLAKQLSAWSPGALLVIGIDTAPAHKRLHGDQAVVAWYPDGIVGFTTKAIPVATEAAASNGRRMAMRPTIYGSSRRLITLPNGETAVLCVCYDAFGLAATAGGSTTHLNAVCLLTEELRAKPPTRQARAALLGSWQQLFATHLPTLALIAVHGFEQPGRDGYWQRHGIATGSAALGGGLAVGAGHFRYILPTRAVQSPLAARGVPHEHLRAGTLRRAHGINPLDAFWSQLGNTRQSQALVRLFEGNPLSRVAGEEVG